MPTTGRRGRSETSGRAAHRGWGRRIVVGVTSVALVGVGCRERPHASPPAAGPVTPPPAPPIVRSFPIPRLPSPRAYVLLSRDTTVAVLPMGPDTVRITARVADAAPKHRVVAAAVNALTGTRPVQWPTGVLALQLTDREFGSLYTTTFPSQQDSLGRLIAPIDVSASPMRLDGDPAVFLVEREEPHSRGRGQAWQVIVLHGAHALATGRVAQPVIQPVRASMDGPLDALPGRQVVVQVNTGTIELEVPLEIAPDSATAVGGIIPRAKHDSATGLDRFAVARLTGPAFPPGSAPHQVLLHRFASDTAADTITVSPTSAIEYGEAYGTATIQRDADPSFVEEVRVSVTGLRLAVTVDGRVGLVDPGDFAKIGLEPLD
jgi:hypothetical protein